MRISYSSATLFQGCKRKFWLKKKGAPIDFDASEDTTALRVGKCFHQILEDCNHDRGMMKAYTVKQAWEDNEIESDTHKGLILGMCQKYLDLHELQGLTVIGCEMEIGDENVIGYIDAIMADKDGRWFIVDLKTAGRLNNSLLSRLERDVQLNLYTYYADQVAKQYGLDMAKFAGTRYRVTTKATIKCGARESLLDFSKRCKDRVESYDIFVPATSLIPEETWENVMSVREEAEEVLELLEHKVPQNRGYCEQYFKPCEWWSRCYGKPFTTAAQSLKLCNTTNAKPVVGKCEDDDLGDLL